MKRNKIIIVILIVLSAGIVLFFYLKKKKENESNNENLPYQQKSESRGIRNKNLGNIKISDSKWLGKIPIEQNTDGVFEQFTSNEYGLRAMIKLIQNYNKMYGINTVKGIITRYSPPFDDQLQVENPTTNYIKSICSEIGKGENDVLSLTNADMYPLIKSMVKFESNYNLSNDEYQRAINLMSV